VIAEALRVLGMIYMFPVALCLSAVTIWLPRRKRLSRVFGRARVTIQYGIGSSVSSKLKY
jgi:hypothetical protein